MYENGGRGGGGGGGGGGEDGTGVIFRYSAVVCVAPNRIWFT